MLRHNLRLIEEVIYPIKRVLAKPSDYPSFMGTLDGFDITALPKVYNPIIDIADNTNLKLLWPDFEDGQSVMGHMPDSNGYVYREFVMENDAIVAYADIEPGGTPKWGDILAHCSLGYLGIRKAKLEGKHLTSELRRFGIYSTLTPSVVNFELFHFFRQLDVEEQGLSTNLKKASAAFMEGCKMHRMSLASFLKKFPFTKDSPLIADWDYGYKPEVAPARDIGHVDIKLNPLWLYEERPWKRRMRNIDGNFYRDLLNEFLRDNKELWTLDNN